MRTIYIALLLSFAGSASLFAESGRAAFDWDAWHRLAVQNGGRHKPLDTLGWETLRLVGNRSRFADPETGERLHPTALYLAMLFDWRGWDHAERDRLLLFMDWSPQYAHLHKPDKWDQAPLVRIDYPELRTRLGLERNQKHVSPEALGKALIDDTDLGRKIPLSAWAERLLHKQSQGETLTELEKKGLELANRLWAYQNHRMGRGLEILPIQGSEEQDWMPLAHVMLTGFDDANDPNGEYRRVKLLLWQARTAFREQDAETFNRIGNELHAVLQSMGPKLGEYPSPGAINLEVAYNRWAPFRFAWVLMLLSAIGMFFHLGTERRGFYFGAVGLYASSIAAALVGFTMRMAISGRAPVTNMYESVVYVGAGVAVLGLIFELIYRKKYILSAAAAVATVTLILADNCPTILDPSVRPLEPVLRSNFWLATHVMTITLSYAAFALALGIGNITLAYFLAGSNDRDTIAALTRFTYKAIQLGVLLLAAGVILGGIWADYSWGRFWGWDPKEVWALVALLGYVAVLHARFAGWVSHRGLAALSVFCFSLVVMAWYGVNFVLGAGLHSYGFGGGGKGWVLTVVGLQLAYAAAAVLKSTPSEHGNSPLSTSDRSNELIEAKQA